MIDFRYHLVSLISVFMALAVGIVLGAGPLKESIGDALTGEVEELRNRSGDLRAELDARTTDLERSRAAMTALAPDVLDGVLTERRVAVVELADVDPAVHESVLTLVEQADATVTSAVQVTDAWVDPEQRSFRASLAGSMIDFLAPVPADDAGTEVELAEALVQSLTRADAADPDRLAQESEVLLQMLLDAGLVSYDAAPGAPADLVLVLAGPTVSLEEVEAEQEQVASAGPEEVQAQSEQQEARVAAGLAIAAAAQDRSSGAVVAGGELADPSVVRAVRQTADLAERISTVDSVNEVAGQLAAVLALGARVDGTVGHYGFGAGAGTPMPPRVQLDPPVRVATGDGTTPDGETADGETADAETEGTQGEETADDGATG